MSVDIEEQYDKIYRYCYFKTHNRETAEDITQETFMRFLESGSYRDTGKALHYLYTIARNLCIDRYRRNRADLSFGKGFSEESLSGEPPWEGLSGKGISGNAGGVLSGKGPEEDVLTKLAVRAALDRLDAGDRELLLLRYVNDVPTAVIGRLLGISRFAVYRRVTHAVGKFKENLGKEGIS